MRIHFVSSQDPAGPPPAPDTLSAGDTLQGDPGSTPYDTIWTEQEEMPTQPPTALEEVMLQQDKIYVVLAVVLIIWLGLAALLFRTNRRITHVEDQLESLEGESEKNRRTT